MAIIQYSPEGVLGQLTEVEAKHAPRELYLEGDVALLSQSLRVSIVGSRKPSREGSARAAKLTKLLVNRSIVVVSGLAAGIDTIAHRTAIREGGRTIAVLGTPLDMAYPAENRSLLDEIKQHHLAVSQFPIGYPSQPKNFPMRNRTMALLSDATIIVEAGEKSGTLHQGWEALRLGRLLFILGSVVRDRSLSWPKKMLDYGAQVLDKENAEHALDELPRFTSNTSIAF